METDTAGGDSEAEGKRLAKKVRRDNRYAPLVMSVGRGQLCGARRRTSALRGSNRLNVATSMQLVLLKRDSSSRAARRPTTTSTGPFTAGMRRNDTGSGPFGCLVTSAIAQNGSGKSWRTSGVHSMTVRPLSSTVVQESIELLSVSARC